MKWEQGPGKPKNNKTANENGISKNWAIYFGLQFACGWHYPPKYKRRR